MMTMTKYMIMIKMKYRDRLYVPGSIPGSVRFFFIASRRTQVLTEPPSQWVPEALSLGVKRLGREADYSYPSSAEVKTGGAIPPLPHMSSWHSA
jgi:hypothetical protein